MQESFGSVEAGSVDSLEGVIGRIAVHYLDCSQV